MLKSATNAIPGRSYNESELRVDLPNGSRITLYGADNYDTLRGIYLDGVILDEYAQMPSKAWTEVIRPSLVDRKGWAIFIGTPKGHNAFYDLFTYAKSEKSWHTAVFRASETGIISKEELRAAKSTMTEDEYNQEFECSFESAIQGAFYADQMRAAKERRICNIAHDEDLLVHTAWDLGFDDATAIIFFEAVGREIRIIDYEEHNGESIQFYSTLLTEKGYKYGTHYLPHDAAAKELGSGKSIEEQLQELGVKNIQIVPRLDVQDGIQAVRMIFPRLWFDQARCKHLIECLTQYHKEFDEERKIFRSKPEHDWSSHASDALRYLAVGFEEQTFDTRPPYRDTSAGRLGF